LHSRLPSTSASISFFSQHSFFLADTREGGAQNELARTKKSLYNLLFKKEKTSAEGGARGD
jgi:hypothetical protein